MLTETERDLILLDHIEQDPDATQATLAEQLDVAVGTINWHIKRLIEKGYVKVRRAERKKLKYIITPEGIALRARLTYDYIQNQFKLYRLVRERVLEACIELRHGGANAVIIQGSGEVAEICRLTCLEQGLAVVSDGSAPVLRVQELKVFIDWEVEV